MIEVEDGSTRSKENDSTNLKKYKRSEVINLVYSKGSKDSKSTIKVENFEAKTIDEVNTWAGENGIIIDATEVASELPSGYIVSQSVEAGEQIAFGDVFTVEVSKGQGTPMPSLIGLSEDEAVAVLNENEILHEISYKYSDNTSSGNVMYQSLAIDDSYYPEDTVNVDVSLGQVFIQDYSGMYLNEAVAAIDELNTSGANIYYNVYEVSSSSSDNESEIFETPAKGTVKSMEPYGEYIATGSTINIYVYG